MAITLTERPKGTYPFGLFHTSSRSTYRQKMESKLLEHLGMFPRKFSLIYMGIRDFVNMTFRQSLANVHGCIGKSLHRI
jgi:hypothetical protein